jgi:hypothetical protein
MMVAPGKEEAAYVFDSVGGVMKCPNCGENTPDAWERFHDPAGRSTTLVNHERGSFVTVDWMDCANDTCKQLVIRVQESYVPPLPYGAQEVALQQTTMWFAFPRLAARAIDLLVPEPFRTDYAEAAAILSISPRMSAVLSRRILQDVLRKYAGRDEFSLAKQIDGFIDDKAQPSSIRDNLHYLREIGDFAAHTQVTDQAEIVSVGQPEAEWTLDVVGRLFDHFIIGPEKDRQMREGMDQKIKAANRKEIPEP